MPKFSNDDSENAVENAVKTLRRMIFDGELRANQPLRQDDLAERLGTSRHPVREALGRLSGEGLVTFRSRRGYVVTSLDPEEINEIFEMRAVLEEHAGYFAASNRTAEDIEAASDLLKKMRTITQPTPQKMRIWSGLNRDFHARIFAASGRRHLCRMIGTLRDSVESYIRKSVADSSLAEANMAHEEIFESFKDGDALQLARLSRRHVRHSAEALLDRLRDAQTRDNPSQIRSPRDLESGRHRDAASTLTAKRYSS
jgi:DNA-binding GntR family transcriptional regulator